MSSAQCHYRSLILGGVKSGKSDHALQLADDYTLGNGRAVTFIATATAGDEAMSRRIARHKSERNPQWHCIEEPLALARTLANVDSSAVRSDHNSCIVIDCLTLWITNLLMLEDQDRLEQEIAQFESAVIQCSTRLIIVSNETNMGVTPLSDLARRFCDETGLLHQKLGRICEHVALMVAGIPLVIKDTH